MVALAGDASQDKQNLDLYWDPAMAATLETWGEKNVWREIQFIMLNSEGRVLDVACGTGKTMEIVANVGADVHGCDISDFLIQKAVERGIAENKLTVCDATRMPYPDNHFNYAYSIGSLEHFTENGIAAFLGECHRVAARASFHMIPVSRSGRDEGWIKTDQSYFNNSVEWWLKKYKSIYGRVYVLESSWEDRISTGKWFMCFKNKTDHGPVVR